MRRERSRSLRRGREVSRVGLRFLEAVIGKRGCLNNSHDLTFGLSWMLFDEGANVRWSRVFEKRWQG